MSAFTPDPNGDIHKLVSADRTTVQAVMAQMDKSPEEFLDLLYEVWVACFLRRDMGEMIRIMELIANVRGWENGGLDTALSV